MKKKQIFTLLASILCLLPVSLLSDTLNWSGIKIEITKDNLCTVGLVADVLLDSATTAKLGLILQNSDYQPLSEDGMTFKTVSSGYSQVVVKKTVKIPQNLEVLQVWTPLFTNDTNSSKLIQRNYRIQELGGRRVAVIASEK